MPLPPADLKRIARICLRGMGSRPTNPRALPNRRPVLRKQPPRDEGELLLARAWNPREQMLTASTSHPASFACAIFHTLPGDELPGLDLLSSPFDCRDAVRQVRVGLSAVTLTRRSRMCHKEAQGRIRTRRREH